MGGVRQVHGEQVGRAAIPALVIRKVTFATSMPISWISSQPTRQQDPIAHTLALTCYGERMRERTMTELASQLEAAMHEICRESRRLGYVPTRFLQMLNEQGALVTVNQLLASDPHHDGFTRLWDLRRLDLSLECVVPRPVFRPLFTEKELNVARWRLRKLDLDPTNCEEG